MAAAHRATMAKLVEARAGWTEATRQTGTICRTTARASEGTLEVFINKGERFSIKAHAAGGSIVGRAE